MNAVHYLFITDFQVDQTKLENKIIFVWFNHFDRIIHAHNNKKFKYFDSCKNLRLGIKCVGIGVVCITSVH